MRHDLEEYRYINEQIISHQRLIFQIFTFSVIAAVALLGYGLQNFFGEQGKISGFALFVILAPVAIIIPCAFIISAIREDIFRWGAYIVVFHEPEGKPGYETRLNKIRDRKNPLAEAYTALVWTYWALCLACCAWFIWGILSALFHCAWSILVIIPLGFLIYGTIRFCRIPCRGNRQQLIDEWRQVAG